MRSNHLSFLTVPIGSIFLVAHGASAAYAACANKDALGVSRTITIDPTGGKLYGGLQYGVRNLLKDREVVLTFDDGPSPGNTRKVLKALASHCTKATFFMVGRMAVWNPAMVREVADAGHTIANHTWSHQNLHKRNARRAGGEIELGISAVRLAAKRPISPFFRFPYLADPNSMLAYGKSRDLAIFSIDIDAYDYKTKSPGKVYSNIMGQLRSRKKGIMLFHDIQSSTANAMQRLLDTLHREDYKIVHIVSKKPVTTLASFDKQAEDLMSKRQTRATAQAIPGGLFESVARIQRRPVARKSSATASKTANAKPQTKSKPSAKPKVAVLPASRTVRRPVARSNSFSAPAPSRTVVSQPARDWRSSVWGNN